jgi:phytoene dehydrogenase-like protein
VSAPGAGRTYDAIVIGGGVNGLTCAAMLGRAGLRTLLVERRDTLGGCATEHEIAPGFRGPTLAHRTGPLRRDVVEHLQLAGHGLRFVERPIRVTSLAPDGRTLSLYADVEKTTRALDAWSPADAKAWPAFDRSLERIGGVVATLFTRTPPDVDSLGPGDLLGLMRTLGAFRGLPKADQWRLLRWAPMAVADLVGECFETDLLQSTVAADGVFGAMLGPWSAGSGLQLILHSANEWLASLRHAEVDGGPAAAVRALAGAARRHGVEIRTVAGVARIEVRNERATGVTLDSGDTIEARAVVSGLDPKRTCLTLCEAEHLPPEFLWRIRHLRARGTLAKVNLALSGLPAAPGLTKAILAGPVRIGPGIDALERAFDAAKYGRLPDEPWIEFTIPSLLDSTLAPEGAHVLSGYVQWIVEGGGRGTGTGAEQRREGNDDGSGQRREGNRGGRGTATGGEPRREGNRDGRGTAAGGELRRENVLEITLRTLERYAPGLRALVVHGEVFMPADMEREWGLTGGHIFHGELSLDQAFTMRPLLGWGRYRTPIRGLYLCGSGTHPGTGLTGGSGYNAAREVAAELR